MTLKMKQFAMEREQREAVSRSTSVPPEKTPGQSDSPESMNMGNKYQEGDLVYELANPKFDLIVRRYVDHRYYCDKTGELGKEEMVFFERQIFPLENRSNTCQ